MEEGDRGGRIENHTRAYSGIANDLNRAVKMAACFNVDREIGTAGVDERWEQRIGIFNHKMDIEGQLRYGMEGLYDWRTDGEVGHETSVHYIHMQQ